jgi:hypothetical protein
MNENEKEKEICMICYEKMDINYCLIRHHSDEKYKHSKNRGHYFHINCIKLNNIKKCPFDRENIKSLKIIKEKVNISDFYDYSLLNLEELLFKDIKNNINRPDLYGRTLLYYACNVSNYNFVKKLLNYDNIDITIGNCDNFTPLMCICSNGALNILKLLLKNKMIEYTFYNVDKNNMTAIEYAIKYQHKKIIFELLQYLKDNKKEKYLEIILNKIAFNGGLGP